LDFKEFAKELNEMAEMARGPETSALDTLNVDVNGRLTKGF